MEKKPLPPLSAQAQALLPPADLSLKCSVFTATLGVDPVGSGISADLVVLIDTPLPWPKPVFEHPELRGINGTFIDAGRTVRVLANVPDPGGQRYLRVFQRFEGRTLSYRIDLADSPAHAALRQVLESTHAPPQSAEPSSELAVLVCTQGSHDICCGAEGSSLASALEADRRFASVDVFRVSHTGGHRFAPTAMTFPDGRMWAYIDPDRLAIAMFRLGPPSAVAPWCRGSWAAPDPVSQVAERLVFARGGWDDADRPVRFEDLGGGIVRVTRGLESHAVRVGVRRDVPVIRCRAAGGLPAKPGREYTAEML